MVQQMKLKSWWPVVSVGTGGLLNIPTPLLGNFFGHKRIYAGIMARAMHAAAFCDHSVACGWNTSVLHVRF
jgi:hypothetical protein